MSPTRSNYLLSQLDVLEAESIHIMRTVAVFERPVLPFSGGKDSIVILPSLSGHFWPSAYPFPVMRLDTGHTIAGVPPPAACRGGARLIVASVQGSVDSGRVAEETGRQAADDDAARAGTAADPPYAARPLFLSSVPTSSRGVREGAAAPECLPSGWPRFL
jgi:hypothetical protein